MFYLVDFSVIKPDAGLIFWTTIIFLLFWFMIGRLAFRPIATALRKREDDIQSALDQAAIAKEEMAKLKADNEKLLMEAREERANMLREANDAKNEIITEAKVKAKSEADRIVKSAKAEIENQKKAAINEVKNQVGAIALEIAEKVIRKELSSDANQSSFVNQLVDDIKFN